ncbi:hypothetical protein FC093_16960 [Ilyomonas limi]|uniref:Uncharacterized protein n=1 Tax=Ilyomonas limi TaxID=2575867 RepID=A0A4U3KY93_9BACT|nr:hypothetical protein [Ilyomonas limi]TKK66724.1 hypothetical protein FC093_16960 [Ilyomonas limi]
MNNDKIDLKKEFARVHSKLNHLIEKLPPVPKETWVSVDVISQVTGWHRNDFLNARRNKLVKYRTVEGRTRELEYLLESIHPMFLLERYRNYANQNANNQPDKGSPS